MAPIYVDHDGRYEVARTHLASADGRRHGNDPFAETHLEDQDFAWVSELTPAENILLDQLSKGVTIVAAATQGFLSLRTANRRLAALRKRAGVESTRDLVRSYHSFRSACDLGVAGV